MTGPIYGHYPPLLADSPRLLVPCSHGIARVHGSLAQKTTGGEELRPQSFALRLREVRGPRMPSAVVADGGLLLFTTVRFDIIDRTKRKHRFLLVDVRETTETSKHECSNHWTITDTFGVDRSQDTTLTRRRIGHQHGKPSTNGAQVWP